MATTRRRSAALILGALSGVLAALTVLPTAFPLTRRLAETEETLALRHASTSAAFAMRMFEDDGALLPGTRERLQIAHLRVLDDHGEVVHQEGAPLPARFAEEACGSAPRMLEDDRGTAWAVACRQSGTHEILTAWSPGFASTTEVLYLVLLLSGLVGIVTALAVSSALSPLSRIGRALDRVGAGERGVRVARTGLSELDDLADRLNVAAQAMESREEAIVARIHVVQEMARLVAHEVRNPLQSLELLTSLIADEDDRTERLELAGSIHAEIRELDNVVHRLLRDPSGSGLRLHCTRESLLPMLQRIVALRTTEAMARGTRIELGSVIDVPVVFDPALLARSIENLVKNAMQVVPKVYGLVRVSAFLEDAHVAIVVDDNGPGVDPAFGDQIFEANVTTRPDGTGLGLTLVRGVVEAHGGTIGYDRSPLGGARFVARIPLSEEFGELEPAESADRR